MSTQQTPDRRRRRSDAERNRELIVRAAITAVHRHGAEVPLSSVAAEAGVGAGTMYRHFGNREQLLEELTHRSFALMLDRMQQARSRGGTAVQILRTFLAGVIEDRDDLVLRTTGGPAVDSERIRGLQDRLHQELQDLISRGRRDGTITRAIQVFDITWIGATLAQPGREGHEWQQVSERLLDTYLAGLGVASTVA